MWCYLALMLLLCDVLWCPELHGMKWPPWKMLLVMLLLHRCVPVMMMINKYLQRNWSYGWNTWMEGWYWYLVYCLVALLMIRCDEILALFVLVLMAYDDAINMERCDVPIKWPLEYVTYKDRPVWLHRKYIVMLLVRHTY